MVMLRRSSAPRPAPAPLPCGSIGRPVHRIRPGSRFIPLHVQEARAAELDALRLTRRLTDAEYAEAAMLANRAYHRERRALLIERDILTQEQCRTGKPGHAITAASFGFGA